MSTRFLSITSLLLAIALVVSVGLNIQQSGMLRGQLTGTEADMDDMMGDMNNDPCDPSDPMFMCDEDGDCFESQECNSSCQCQSIGAQECESDSDCEPNQAWLDNCHSENGRCDLGICLFGLDDDCGEDEVCDGAGNCDPIIEPCGTNDDGTCNGGICTDDDDGNTRFCSPFAGTCGCITLIDDTAEDGMDDGMEEGMPE